MSRIPLLVSGHRLYYDPNVTEVRLQGVGANMVTFNKTRMLTKNHSWKNNSNHLSSVRQTGSYTKPVYIMGVRFKHFWLLLRSSVTSMLTSPMVTSLSSPFLTSQQHLIQLTALSSVRHFLQWASASPQPLNFLPILDPFFSVSCEQTF